MADETRAPALYAGADLSLIKRIIPHRYPFLFIDKVRDIVPHEPVMPGVTIVEAMAQTAAVIVGISMNIIDKPLATYFMGIDKCKFRRMVVPGDMLELHVKALRGGGKIWKFEGRALVDGQLCASAEFTAMMALKANA